MQRRAIIARSDFEMLEQLLHHDSTRGLADDAVIAALTARLRQAVYLDEGDMPTTVVTMHSIVLLSDIDSGETEEFTLVYPDEADILHGKLTVLAPIGLAVLGSRVGETLSVPVPSGERRLDIADILYQPQHLLYGGNLRPSL